MNSVEFELRLKDMMSGVLPKVQNTARSVFDGVDRIIGKTQKNFNDIFGKEHKLKVDYSSIEQAGRELDNFKRKADGISALSIFKGSFLGNIAARGVERGFEGLKGLGRSAFDAGADAEQQIIGLGTFLGKGKAKDLYAQLQRESALTPYTTKDILPGMLQLVASGQTPDKAKKDLWSLMNALSATGNAGNSFALELGESHLAQMASVGKVDAYFMKEFQRTLHIPMTKLLSDYTGKPMKQIAEWTENGELKDHVTYDMFVGALDKAARAGGMFAGALEAQSQTIRGKASTIKDWWNIGMAKLALDPKIHDNIIRLEDRLIHGLENFPELIGKISPVINKLFDNLDELLPSFKNLGAGIIDVLTPIKELALSDAFKDLIKNVTDLSAAILNTPLLKKALGLAGEALQGASGLVSYGGQSVKNTWNWLFNPDQYERDNDPRVMTSSRKGYIWGTAPIGTAPGMVVDSAAMRHVVDSLGQGNFFPDQKAADDFGIGFMRKWYPKTAFDTDMLPLPMKAKDVMSRGKAGGAAGAAEEVSDAIIGGGKRQTIINLNSPLYKVEKQYFQNIHEAINDFETRVKDALARIMAMVPSS